MFIQNDYIRKLVSMKLLPRIYFHSKGHKKLILNLLKCEAHREIMIETLDKKLDK